MCFLLVAGTLRIYSLNHRGDCRGLAVPPGPAASLSPNWSWASYFHVAPRVSLVPFTFSLSFSLLLAEKGKLIGLVSREQEHAGCQDPFPPPLGNSHPCN